MASATQIDNAVIKTVADLNEDGIKRLLEKITDTKEAFTIVSIGDRGAPDGANNHFASEITKLTVRYRREGADGDDEAVHLIVKVPLKSGVMKHIGKIRRFFRKEVLAYTRRGYTHTYRTSTHIFFLILLPSN